MRCGGWFLSLVVLTVVACDSSPTAGSGDGGGGADGGADGGATFLCPKNSTSAVPLRCQHGLQYCRSTSTGSVNCEALPAACGSTPSCSCIPLFFQTCDSCTQSASGDIDAFFSADCPGP